MRPSATVAALLTAGLLSACSSFAKNKNVGSEWNCGAVEGYTCQSIEETRRQIARPGASIVPGATVAAGGTVAGTVPPLFASSSYVAADAPIWRPDQVMKVQFAPFVDATGNYHARSQVYAVVQKGGWEKKSVN